MGGCHYTLRRRIKHQVLHGVTQGQAARAPHTWGDSIDGGPLELLLPIQTHHVHITPVHPIRGGR